jgi:DnaK suppressor protein
MASKKAAPKARKPGKSAAPARAPARKAPGHKVDTHKAEARKPAASAKRTAREPAREAHKESPHRDARREPAHASPKASPKAAPQATGKSAAVPAAPAAKPAASAGAARPAKAAASPAQPKVAASVASAARPFRAPAQPEGPAPRFGQRAEAEEAEGAEPGSLLAGPRNVKPYIAKRGEQYMGKQQAEHFREILSNWKRDLMEEVDRTVTHMKDEAANFPDPNDRATQEEEFSLELRTRDRERKLIRKIDEALKRIEDGSYGYCLETGEEIGIKRLEARPVATLSIEAQERRERRERQYGDRDDRYR